MRAGQVVRRCCKALAAVLAATLLQPAAATPTDEEREISPAQRACPAGLDDVATCYAGRDANGAWYLAAMPRDWNRVLVVHAHGGPRLGEPQANDSDEDLERFSVMVREGYAWIGSTYRRGGYGVRMAAEDVDNSRALFWAHFARPRLTILHGQSYGANVAAKLAELRSADANGDLLYDGVLLTNGVLRGGTRAYGFRADLRAVYQYFCRNHPRPDEVQYPVWQGLPPESSMTSADLEARVNACLGLDLPSSQRTLEQTAKLAGISGATGIAERDLVRHLEWATFTFRDLVNLRLGGRNPFDNSMTIYEGSGDDANLNGQIERFVADPRAVRQLAYDADLTGRILVPTVAIHWAHDPIASAMGDREYQDQVSAQGNGNLFLSIWTSSGTHSRLASPDLLAALEATVTSAEQGQIVELSRVWDLCLLYSARLHQNCTVLRTQ